MNLLLAVVAIEAAALGWIALWAITNCVAVRRHDAAVDAELDAILDGADR